MSHELIRWLHIVGVVLSLGSSVLFVVGVVPALSLLEDSQKKYQVLARVLQAFHPLLLLGLCVTFMTGAMRLTDLKMGFGTSYYGALGSLLMIKFGLTTLIFMIAAGQCFGMGLKLTRMANGVMEGTVERQEKLAGLIHKMTIYNIILIAVTIYFGLRLIPMIYGDL